MNEIAEVLKTNKLTTPSNLYKLILTFAGLFKNALTYTIETEQRALNILLDGRLELNNNQSLSRIRYNKSKNKTQTLNNLNYRHKTLN